MTTTETAVHLTRAGTAGAYQVTSGGHPIGDLVVTHLVEPGPLGVQEVVTSTVTGEITIGGSAYKVGLTFQSMPELAPETDEPVEVGGTAYRVGLPGGGPADVMQTISQAARIAVLLDHTPVRIAEGRVAAAQRRMSDARVQAEIATATYHKYLSVWISATITMENARKADGRG